MPQARFAESVNASVDTIWRLLEDKVEHPARYVPGVAESAILERFPGGVVRTMRLPHGPVTERITLDRDARLVTFALIDHPQWHGSVINRIDPAPSGGDGAPVLVFEMDWRPHDPSTAPALDMNPTIRQAVLHTKALAEAAEARSGGGAQGGA
jgi:hypothetical protein